MRKIISLGAVTLLFSIFSSTVIADPADGLCDSLKADGVTKGLYGLCVAFHSSGGDRDKIRQKYEDRMKDGDPSLPMEGECACWGMTEIQDAIGPSGCFVDTGFFMYGIVFANGSFYAGNLLFNGTYSCSYGGGYPQEIDEASVNVCISDIETMASAHGLTCEVF